MENKCCKCFEKLPDIISSGTGKIDGHICFCPCHLHQETTKEIKAFCLECGAKYHTWLSDSKECPNCEGQIAFHDILEQKEEYTRKEWLKDINSIKDWRQIFLEIGSKELGLDLSLMVATVGALLSRELQTKELKLKEEITETIRKTNELEISDWITKGGAGMIKDNFISKINEI